MFVPATFGVVWLGTQFSTIFLLDWRTWVALILAYCVVASLAPMWLLLQPRGYLGGFVLYAALIAGTLGIFFGGFEIRQPAFVGFDVGGPTGLLFPFLFVTIACGACSGFHGLVCSGTTSKQIDRETHCHPIGYGAMLLEAFVAVIAGNRHDRCPPPAGHERVYARGLGAFMEGARLVEPRGHPSGRWRCRLHLDTMTRRRARPTSGRAVRSERPRIRAAATMATAEWRGVRRRRPGGYRRLAAVGRPQCSRLFRACVTSGAKARQAIWFRGADGVVFASRHLVVPQIG